MNKANPVELDHMPREVATALLTTPGTKLSAAMRRNCKQTRVNFVPSKFPILNRDEGCVYDTSKMAKTEAERYMGLLSRMNALRLAREYSKVLHRRRAVQYLYERCDNEAGCNKYNTAAMALDMKRDCIEAELDRRRTRKAK